MKTSINDIIKIIFNGDLKVKFHRLLSQWKASASFSYLKRTKWSENNQTRVKRKYLKPLLIGEGE